MSDQRPSVHVILNISSKKMQKCSRNPLKKMHLHLDTDGDIWAHRVLHHLIPVRLTLTSASE